MSPATLAEYLEVARKAGLMQMILTLPDGTSVNAVLGPEAPGGDVNEDAVTRGRPFTSGEPGGWKKAIPGLDDAFEDEDTQP